MKPGLPPRKRRAAGPRPPSAMPPVSNTRPTARWSHRDATVPAYLVSDRTEEGVTAISELFF